MASIKKNFLYYLLFIITNILFPVLVFPYIARILGPEGLGNSQFALQFSKYFVLIASLGIPIYGMREVAKVKHRKLRLSKLVSELIILNIVTAVLSTIIYLAVIGFTQTFANQQHLFLIAGLQVLLGCLSIDWFFAGLEDFKIITIRTLVIRLATVVMLLLFVKTKDDVLPYLIISILSIIAGYLWVFFYALTKIKIVVKGLQFTNHLRPIFLIFLMNVCITMYTVFDTVWIGLLSTPVAIGLYTSAMKLCKIGIPFVTSLGTVLIPRSARKFAVDEKVPQHLNASYNFIVDLAVPMGVGLFLLSPELLEIFSGSEFLPALWSMRLLAALPLFIGLSNLFGMQMLSASGNDLSLLFCVFGGMLLNILLNVLLVPSMAHTGAAIAMFFTELAVTLLTFAVSKAKFNSSFSLMRMVKSLMLSIAFIPVIWVCRIYFGDVLVVIFAIPSCLFIYVLLQHLLFKNEFVQIAMQFIQQKRVNHGV